MAVCIEVQNLKVRSLDVDFHEITWAVAEAILFIEISRRYAHLSDQKVTKLFDYEEPIQPPFWDFDDDDPF